MGNVLGFGEGGKGGAVGASGPSDSPSLKVTIRQLREKRQRRPLHPIPVPSLGDAPTQVTSEDTPPSSPSTKAPETTTTTEVTADTAPTAESEPQSPGATMESEAGAEESEALYSVMEEEEESADLYSDATCHQVHTEIFLEDIVEDEENRLCLAATQRSGPRDLSDRSLQHLRILRTGDAPTQRSHRHSRSTSSSGARAPSHHTNTASEAIREKSIFTNKFRVPPVDDPTPPSSPTSA